MDSTDIFYTKVINPELFPLIKELRDIRVDNRVRVNQEKICEKYKDLYPNMQDYIRVITCLYWCDMANRSELENDGFAYLHLAKLCIVKNPQIMEIVKEDISFAILLHEYIRLVHLKISDKKLWLQSIIDTRDNILVDFNDKPLMTIRLSDPELKRCYKALYPFADNDDSTSSSYNSEMIKNKKFRTMSAVEFTDLNMRIYNAVQLKP